MANSIKLLQRKVDEAFTDLANYESEKANLEVAMQAGMARRGSSVRMTRLRGMIRGAKLRLSNTEKKLQEALRLEPEPLYQQLSPETSGFCEPKAAAVNQENPVQGPNINISETRSMVVDNAMINPPMTTPNLPAKEVGHALPIQLFSTIVDGNESHMLAAGATTVGCASSSFVEAFNVSPQDMLPSGNSMTVADNNQPAMLTLGFMAPPHSSVQVSQAPSPSSRESTSSFKHIDRSESEDELSRNDSDMTLMIPNDKVQLQQELFKARFSEAPLPKKVKYMEVSDDSEATGDPNFFNDDDEEVDQTGVMRQIGALGLTQPGNAIPTVTVQRRHVPLAKDSQASNACLMPASLKGKDRETGTKEPKGKGATALRAKGKGVEKDQKGGEEFVDPRKITGGDDADRQGKDNDDYHPSEYSIAKATRLTEVLTKQRERFTDEATHREFVEKWLNARSAAERPEFPKGIELIRLDPNYLPDVATADYHLTIQLLLNHSNNYLCMPHTKLNRKLVSHVDNLEGPTRIWGTPLPRNQNPNMKTSISRVPEHFHCGCHEKVALAGFVMWKTWKARSMIGGELVVEGLHQNKPFSPRDVLFILQFLKSKFGYTVEDMFTGSFDVEEELRNEAR